MNIWLVDCISGGDNLAYELKKRKHSVNQLWSSTKNYEKYFRLFASSLYNKCLIYRNQKINSDVLIQGSDSGLELAEKLNPINPQNTVDLRLNRNLLIEKINQPVYYNKVDKNFIIKPIRSTGGYDRIVKTEKSTHIKNGFFGQPFYEGTEYAVDTVSKNGFCKLICVWKYYKKENSFFRKKIELLDYDENKIIINKLYNFIINVLNVAGYQNGAAHSEVIVTNDGIKLIEVNFRTHGHMGFAATKYALGNNQWEILADTIENKIQISNECVYSTYKHVRQLFIPNHKGRFAFEIPWKKIERIQGISKIYRSHAEFEFIPENDMTYQGLMFIAIIIGNSKDELNEIEDKINFEIK